MAKYPSICRLAWYGHSSAENQGNIATTYTGGKLLMGIYVEGTPVLGKACAVSIHAMNFKFKNGGVDNQLFVYGQNFNMELLEDVTPQSSYKGEELDFAVSIITGVFETFRISFKTA